MTGDRPRPDVGPLSWEIPAAAMLGWLAGGLLLLPAARATTALLSGGGWVWPADGAALLASIGGLLTGDPAAGLPPARAADLPGTGAVYAAVTGAVYDALPPTPVA